MLKKALLFLMVLSFQCIDAQITLTNNIGTTLIRTDMYSCEESESWSRVFNLSDFGIAANEQFVIKSGQIGLSKSDIGANLQICVYSIDASFPVFFIQHILQHCLECVASDKRQLLMGLLKLFR